MRQDYRLIIRQENDAYLARWMESAGQPGEEFPLTLPLDKEKLDRLRWYLEKYYEFPDHGGRVKAEAVERELEHWGRALFDALFHTPEGIQWVGWAKCRPVGVVSGMNFHGILPTNWGKTEYLRQVDGGQRKDVAHPT